ncbi:MAG: ABC transporter permease [Solirubrobacteraceae bacterium]
MLALCFLYVPILMVIVNSVNGDRALVSWGGFTTRWYHQAVTDPQVRGPFVTSIEIALISTALSLVLAVSAGLWWRGASPRQRAVLNGLTGMRIMLPEVVTAVAMFLFFKKTGLALGTTAVIVGHVVFNSAYATVIIQARLSTMDMTLEEAASDLGARPWRAFRRVTLPMLAPAILVAALLALIFSFDDVITSLFLAGAQTETLPLLLFGLIRFQVTPEVNAIGSGVMLITAVTFMLAVLASRFGSARIATMIGFGGESA